VFAAWNQLSSFAAVEAAVSRRVLVQTAFGDRTRAVGLVSPGVFEMLGGVRPTMGRLLGPADSVRGRDAQALIAEQMWRADYGGDPDIVGRKLRIDGDEVVIVGVLPARFRFPNWDTEVWRATDFTDLSPDARGGRPAVYIRFNAAVPVESALQSATVAARQADRRLAEWRAHAEPLLRLISTGRSQNALPLVSGGVVLLCIVLATNAASLMVLSVLQRRRDLSIRRALGATGVKVFADGAADPLLVGALSAVGGMLLSFVLVSVSRQLLEGAGLLRSLNPLDLDARALFAGGIFSLLLGLAVGLIGATAAWVQDDSRWLRSIGDVTLNRVRTGNTRRVVMAVQIALSILLLFGATVLTRTFLVLAAANQGFDPEAVRVATIAFPQTQFATSSSRGAAAHVLAEHIGTLPGIARRTWSYGTPPGGGLTDRGAWQTAEASGPVQMAVRRFLVEPAFFDTYQLDIITGRTFATTGDDTAVLVSERFALALWPGSDAVGRLFHFEGAPFRVIGVVRELRYPSLDAAREVPQWFLPLRQIPPTAMLTVRCNAECPDLSILRQRLTAASSGARIVDVVAPTTLYRRELAWPRAMASIAGLLAAAAIGAAGLGLFTIVSNDVADRRREFAVRLSLGASPSHIRSLVWREVALVAVPGLAVGILASQWATDVLTSLILGDSLDLVSWAVVLVTVAIAVAVACWHPVRAVSRLAPASVIRE
jgi:predicted permease